MEILKEYLFTVIIPIIGTGLASIVTAIIAWVKTKLKNTKLIDLIPEAMLYAESIGGDGSAKLQNALMWLRDKLKFNEQTAINYIEQFITVSKTINKNKQGVKNDEKVSDSRITSKQR